MEISREEFERVIELSYCRGRVTQGKKITQKEIDTCIADVYDLVLDIEPPDTDKKNKNMLIMD